jgi:hypothetical protein
MNVAIDTDCLPLPTFARRCETTDLTVYTFSLIRGLQTPDSPVDRLLVLTRDESHTRFEPLRDGRTDVALINRPLFEGRPVGDWAALLEHHPRVGGELLAEHQGHKLRVMAELGASVLHFPTDAHELMEIDCPIVLTLHDARAVLSSTLADALVVHSPDLRPMLPHFKTFCALFPSTPGEARADESPMPAPRYDLVGPLCEAYEHALASYELRKAA